MRGTYPFAHLPCCIYKRKLSVHKSKYCEDGFEVEELETLTYQLEKYHSFG
jgi:hypothetical protein